MRASNKEWARRAAVSTRQSQERRERERERLIEPGHWPGYGAAAGAVVLVSLVLIWLIYGAFG